MMDSTSFLTIRRSHRVPIDDPLSGTRWLVLQRLQVAHKERHHEQGGREVLTLAIAIGANTAIFSAVDAVLLHPLPYPEPDRLMTVTENLPHYSLRGLQPSFSEFLEYRRMATCFSAIAAVTGGDATLTGEGQPEDVDAKRVSSAAFPMIGITSVLGGLFTTEDEQYGKDHVVILSEGLWRRRYGGDRTIIGKNIRINRESYRVVGVIQRV